MAFRFECQPDCSNCCQVEGQVYLRAEDIPRIAEHLAIPAAEFERRYVYRTARHIKLRKPPDRQCYFHRDNRCAIHSVKPTQCRTFPFWPELVENQTAWDEAAQYCPGMGKGELVQIEAAWGIANDMYAAYPEMYPEKP